MNLPHSARRDDRQQDRDLFRAMEKWKREAENNKRIIRHLEDEIDRRQNDTEKLLLLFMMEPGERQGTFQEIGLAMDPVRLKTITGLSPENFVEWCKRLKRDVATRD